MPCSEPKSLPDRLKTEVPGRFICRALSLFSYVDAPFAERFSLFFFLLHCYGAAQAEVPLHAGGIPPEHGLHDPDVAVHIQSILFECFVVTGYAFGLAGKFLSGNITYVVAVYLLDIAMVSADLVLTLRNKRLDRLAEKGRA